MPQLIAPTVGLREAWLAAHADWGPEDQHGSGLDDTDDVSTPDGFATWVGWLTAQPGYVRTGPQDRVPATYWWIAEGGEILGAVSLRHALNAKLLEAGGHIGYGIRPAARRRGLATWAVRETLAVAAGRGIDRVLITCDESNVASAAVIERCGGQLEDVRDTWLGRSRRYWTATA